VRPWASKVCPVSDASLVGEARRMGAALAQEAGLDETRCGEVSIVVSEIGHNIVRHAGGHGEVVVRALEQDDRPGIEILGIDRGPGIANVTEARRDGYSTQGTPGTGLGAIERQATEFEMHSMVGAGTVVMARVWKGRQRPTTASWLQIGAICLARPGETACGDGWRAIATSQRTLLLMADGLGHGLAAAEAARTALGVFADHAHLEPVRLVETLHAALRATRGAAVAVTVVPRGPGEIDFVGVGNIAAGLTTTSGTRSFVSHSGAAGVEARRIQALRYPWTADALLIEHSDGLATSWDLSRYPGLRMRDPAVIAAVLYRDHRRIRDDVTVLVARQMREAAA
jgi:anti-sigma regulatory factor (Ser/Thr protein kinase)